MQRLGNISLIILRGIGQVFFQNNALSGFIMLVGIAVSSWQMALLALLGNITGNVTAYVGKFNRNDIRDGLYGFNGTLVGIAVGIFLHISTITFTYLIVASALSSVIARLLNMQKSLPGLTTPFVIATWTMILLSPESLILTKSGTTESFHEIDLIDTFGLSFGQVMFQGVSIITGILFLIGIAINSRIQAIYALLGAAISTIIAVATYMDATAINTGLMGYNGILCAMAFGKPDGSSLAKATIAATVSVGLQYAGLYYGITTLTAPFVASVWLTTITSRLLKKSTTSQ